MDTINFAFKVMNNFLAELGAKCACNDHVMTASCSMLPLWPRFPAFISTLVYVAAERTAVVHLPNWVNDLRW